MELFYLPQGTINPDSSFVTIDGDAFHHLVRVLRKREGEQIHVTDGAGLCASIRIEQIGKEQLSGLLLACERQSPPATRVTIALSLLKAPHRFDFFLEKATELGVDGIIPLLTERTVVRVKQERNKAKLERWQSIILAAARQSRRYYLPVLEPPATFRQLLARTDFDSRLIPYELSSNPPLFACAGKRLLFLVGGEGGFSDAEVTEAVTAGFQPISFGKSILRAETAAIFAMASVRSRLLSEHSGVWL